MEYKVSEKENLSYIIKKYPVCDFHNRLTDRTVLRFGTGIGRPESPSPVSHVIALLQVDTLLKVCLLSTQYTIRYIFLRTFPKGIEYKEVTGFLITEKLGFLYAVLIPGRKECQVIEQERDRRTT